VTQRTPRCFFATPARTALVARELNRRARASLAEAQIEFPPAAGDVTLGGSLGFFLALTKTKTGDLPTGCNPSGEGLVYRSAIATV